MGVYRPPQSNIDNTIDLISTQLDKIHNPNNPLLIMGDINVDSLTDNNEKQTLAEALGGYNIKRLELPATRITNHSRTSIDFICTNLNEEQVTCSVNTTGLSNHTAQICSIKAEVENTMTSVTKRRIVNENTMEEARRLLKAQNWNIVTDRENTDEAFKAFDGVMRFMMDTACPYKQIKIKTKDGKRKLWDAESLELKRSYLEALNREILTGNDDDKRNTALIKKNYDLKLKNLRKKQNVDFIEQADNKSKALWKVINYERKEKNTATYIRSLNDNEATYNSPASIANHLNEFFATVAERILNQSRALGHHPQADRVQILPQPHPIPNLQLYHTTEEEIKKVIDSMKSKSSAGEDDISSKIIKSCKDEIITPLKELINKSFDEGTFPNSLKTSKVYPKYKSGQHTEAANYRPISLISNFSKILERIALTRLLEHLQQHNLLTPNQHGFIRNRSTATALIQLVESIIDKLEQGHIATTVLLDFSKAFDCLDHKLIIKKLQNLGINGKELQWFDSYLSNRK